MPTWARMLWACGLGSCAAACGAARQSEPVRGKPVQLDAEERGGQRVFMRERNGCHPQGDGGLGPALNDEPVPAAAIKLQVREGAGAMPSFSGREISSEELDALVHERRGVPLGRLSSRGRGGALRSRRGSG